MLFAEVSAVFCSLCNMESVQFWSLVKQFLVTVFPTEAIVGVDGIVAVVIVEVRGLPAKVRALLSLNFQHTFIFQNH